METAHADDSVWIERLGIVTLATFYLVTFNRVVPHGDALRIVRQIEDGRLIWNPNHLIFDPLGYGWFSLLQRLGFGISALDSFEIISGVTAVASLLLFHALLLQVGITGRGMRALAVGGLFGSQAFLSMSISQYYFMVQMPFLLGVLLLAVRLISREAAGRECTKCIYGMGILSAIAGTLMFNNVLLVGALGLASGLAVRPKPSWNVANVIRLWLSAAAVGVPVFVFGYMASGTSSSFFQWLLSYQGDSDTKLNDLYGMDWTLQGVAVSIARAIFAMLSSSTIETAGMGTVIRVVTLREPLEFVPEVLKLSLALCLTPIVAMTVAALFIWGALRLRQDRLVQFNFAWLGAYFVFNVLWSSSGDLFWFQVLPVLWLLLMVCLQVSKFSLSDTAAGGRRYVSKARWLLIPIVPALIIVNTLQTAVPVSRVDLAALGRDHMSLLQEGDIQILPGWDGFGWLPLDAAGPTVSRVTLMDMALEKESSDRHIKHLPRVVADQLASGRRVIVGRLFDRDRGINPWYGLSRLGWPRARIQSLLGRYCTKELGRVDDVVFRQIVECQE